ncbi:hypothetical protein CGT94_18080 [Vibrio metoecus]|uniref:hypothetical protein n=1 Tax=Vibrio metoecus TaxID=1481663 RepID=UPI0006D7E9BE|nr:hypothetical protein [Vibrio metoecus]KQB05582.1 hypothetical protein XV93_11465 [Vibrio metoecus]PAR45891.1 hypothetical protein CGT94_18080 [Vibrio metoecus]
MLLTNYVENNTNEFGHEIVIDKDWLVIIYVGSQKVDKDIKVPSVVRTLGSEIEKEVWLGTNNHLIVSELSPLFSELFQENDFNEPFVLAIQLGKSASIDRACFYEKVIVDNEDSDFIISQKFATGIALLRKSIVKENFNDSKNTFIKSIANSTLQDFIKALIKLLI